MVICFTTTALIAMLEALGSSCAPDKPTVEPPPQTKDGSAGFTSPEQRKNLEEEQHKGGLDPRAKYIFLANIAKKQAFLAQHQATDKV